MATKLTQKGWIGRSAGYWSKTGADQKITDLVQGISLRNGTTSTPGSGNLIINGAINIDGILDCRNQVRRKTTILATAKEGQIESTRQAAIDIDQNSAIKLGNGDDILKGTIATNTPPTSWVTSLFGILNMGLIDTGGGDDTITGIHLKKTGMGISNSGTIVMGDGDDLIDALTGGFSGDGYIDMGSGINTVMGIGDQTIDGGGNEKNKILLGAGKYQIVNQEGEGLYKSMGLGAFSISDLNVTTGIPVVMDIDGFGLIGGAGKQASLLRIREGTLVIGNNGNSRYLS